MEICQWSCVPNFLKGQFPEWSQLMGTFLECWIVWQKTFQIKRWFIFRSSPGFSKGCTGIVCDHRTAGRYSWTRARNQIFPTQFIPIILIQFSPSQSILLISKEHKAFRFLVTRCDLNITEYFFVHTWASYPRSQTPNPHVRTISTYTQRYTQRDMHQHPDTLINRPTSTPHTDSGTVKPSCSADDRALTHVELNDLEAAKEGHAPPS